MAVKSPPNKRQNEALAKVTSSNTSQGFCLSELMMSVNLVRAVAKSVLPSAISQLNLLNCVLMLKLVTLWRTEAMELTVDVRPSSQSER